MSEKINDSTILIDDSSDPRDYNICRFIPGKDEIKDVEFMLDLPELQIILRQYYGSCAGHAFAMAKSINEYQKTHKWIEFCPYMIYGTRYEGEYTGVGMYLRQGAKVLYNDGAFFERDFGKAAEMPQLQADVEKFKSENPSLVEQAKNYRIEGYAFVNGTAEIKTALKAGMPVVVSIDSWSGMGAIDGYVEVTEKKNNTSCHAVCIVGWKTKNDRTYWIIVNSWGTLLGWKGLLFFDTERKIYEAISVSDTITPSKVKCKNIEFTIGSSEFTADGEVKTFECSPYIKNNRTYLPIRFVAENLGASVEWNEETGEATIRSEESIIVITNSNKNISINGKKTKMDVAPEIVNDRMMAPIRYLAETLNCEVNWDASKSKVTISAL